MGIYTLGCARVLLYNISFEQDTSVTVTCLFISTHVMDYSLMLNAESSMLSSLWTCFRHWELSASLQESFTRMVAFTSTALSTLDDDTDHDRLRSSMLEVTTPMLWLVEEHLTKDMLMRSRMEMSYAGGSGSLTGSRAEREIARLIRSGLRLRVQLIERSFGDFCMSWIQSRRLATTILSRSTLTGDLNQCLPYMSHPLELHSAEERLMAEMIGYRSLESEWENHC